jgi:superfamily II DNA or RNA helicase
MEPVNIELRDGFVEVRGKCPGLTEKLRYFRRELKRVGWKREVKGRWEDLYSVDPANPDVLFTMQGFAHRVLDYCRNANIKFTFADKRTPMPKPNMAKAMQGLRPYQQELVARMLVSGGGILQAATGAGKSHMAAAIIRAYDRDELMSRHTPTCVFACPNKDINRKNWEEFKKIFPDREVGIYMSGAHKPSDDIVCCSIDSLENIDPAMVGVLIVDEMHASASDTRAQKIASFAKAAKWGVSATPDGRFDGKDLVSEGLYGPVVATFTYKDGIASGALVPITVYWVDSPPPDKGLEAYANLQNRDTRMRWGNTANESACMMVADILNCVPDSLQTLCVVQFIDHMGRIHRRCRKTGFVHAETDPSKIEGFPTLRSVSTKERKELYDKFRNGEISSMISTGCWSTGVDFPDLRVIVNAGGCGSDILAKQILGRASRKADGKDRAYIVDFVHQWDRSDPVAGTGRPGPLLSNDAARRKAYRDLGFEQIACTSITQLPFLNQEQVSKTETVEMLRRTNPIL